MDPPVVRIAFGSCMHQAKPQPFWRTVASLDPHRFVMLGDGIYPDAESHANVIESLERAYGTASEISELARFRSQVPVTAIWDDNDFGGSDIGGEFPQKLRSRELFLRFWASDRERIQRARKSGIYGLWEWGSVERRTQLIVPDLRYNRSEWVQQEPEHRSTLARSGYGPYRSVSSPDATMLGEVQWAWLEACLRRPAELRILASSIQFVPTHRGWESWWNFPLERQKFLSLLRDSKASGLILISGDTHYGELSCLEEAPYPLWELTASGLTETWPRPGANRYRVGKAHPQTNFGVLHINWLRAEPEIVLELRETAGGILIQQAIPLRQLQA